MMGHPFQASGSWLLLQWAAVLAGALAAAATDLRRRRIANWLTLPMLACGLIIAGAAGGRPVLADRLRAAVLLGLPFVALYAFAGGGAGDSKLMAAIGAWVGTYHGLLILAAVLLWGGLVGLAWAIAHRRLRQVARNLRWAGPMFLVAVARRRAGPEGAGETAPTTAGQLRMPYALAIFLGAATVAVGSLAWAV